MTQNSFKLAKSVTDCHRCVSENIKYFQIGQKSNSYISWVSENMTQNSFKLAKSVIDCHRCVLEPVAVSPTARDERRETEDADHTSTSRDLNGPTTPAGRTKTKATSRQRATQASGGGSHSVSVHSQTTTRINTHFIQQPVKFGNFNIQTTKC